MRDLLCALLQCPSVSPNENGSLAVVAKALPKGFRSEILSFGGGHNGVFTWSPPHSDERDVSCPRPQHFCFAGHVDVVPAGDDTAWTHPPFAGVVTDEGVVYGRGASDMKGSIAAFVEACHTFLNQYPDFQQTLSLILTADEETVGAGMEGVMASLAAHKRLPEVCLVGEPTSVDTVGDTLKHGRRGSLTATLTVHGTQGHVAYPQAADNPVPKLTVLLQALHGTVIDAGTPDFQASNLEVVALSTSSNTSNMIPASASALVNVRYNTEHTPRSMEAWVHQTLAALHIPYTLQVHSNNAPFLSDASAWRNAVMAAVADITGTLPALSTSGGTSDARTIHPYGPVLELGLLNHTAHKVDEHVRLQDLETLRAIYHRILERFFYG